MHDDGIEWRVKIPDEKLSANLYGSAVGCILKHKLRFTQVGGSVECRDRQPVPDRPAFSIIAAVLAKYLQACSVWRGLRGRRPHRNAAVTCVLMRSNGRDRRNPALDNGMAGRAHCWRARVLAAGDLAPKVAARWRRRSAGSSPPISTCAGVDDNSMKSAPMHPRTAAAMIGASKPFARSAFIGAPSFFLMRDGL